jgi:hypothetical protein
VTTARSHGFLDPRRSAAFLLALVLSVLFPNLLSAWPSPAYRAMAYDTLRLMPPSLARVLGRNERFLLEGVYGLEGETASELARQALRGNPGAAASKELELRIKKVTGMVDAHQPFREVALELGKILRIAADLADPCFVGAAEPRMSQAAAEYLRFVQAHVDRIPMVYDRGIPSLLEGASLPTVLGYLTVETGTSAARLGEVFFRGDQLVSASEFDYRSVPYAEASLNYSRAVTAASHLWLLAWSAAHGDLSGTPFLRNLPELLLKKNKKARR